MVSESKTAGPEKNSEQSPSSPYVLLVELEGAAVPARQAEYETLGSLIGDAKKKIPPHLFSRLALDTPSAIYIPKLLDALGSKKSGVEKLAQEVASGVLLYLSSPEAALQPAAERMMSAAQQRQMEVILLTAMKESVVHAFVERCPAVCRAARIYPYEATREKHPRADILLKTAKALGRTPRQCIVVVGTATAARAALSAGMRCVVLADAYTVHQDFSGVDHVIEPGEECDAAALFRRLAPAP